MKLRPRWPDLKQNHPGYWSVLSGLLMYHGYLAWDHLFLGVPRQNIYWSVMFKLAPVHVWGAMHLLIVVLCVIGLYSKFSLARLGMLLSFSVCAATTVAVAFVYIPLHLSYLGIVLNLFVTLCSWAALTEPETNPASSHYVEVEHAPDGD